MTIYSIGSRTSHLLSVLLISCALLLLACSEQRSEAQSSGHPPPPDSVPEIADQVLAALKTKDGKRLASLVSPQKGVRFSPSAYVDVDEDIVLSRDQIQAFWMDSKTYLWGYAEGSGDPIELTPAVYSERYILDRDFSKPSSVNVNDDQAAGTTRNNAADIYPEATRVEYYIEAGAGGSERINDWAALRLVFENTGDSWYLVAVIHDLWSP